MAWADGRWTDPPIGQANGPMVKGPMGQANGPGRMVDGPFGRGADWWLMGKRPMGPRAAISEVGLAQEARSHPKGKGTKSAPHFQRFLEPV